MSKLFKLKRWLTLQEAARYLTTIFGEPVLVADVLRLGLDYRLTLSVVFVDGVWASVCKPVEKSDLQYVEFPNFDNEGTHSIPIGGQIIYTPRGQMLQVQSEVFPLDDECYDLTMMGGECADVEQEYWALVGGARQETTSLDGTFVCEPHGTKARWFQLKERLPARKGEPASYYPMGGLPENAAIVVRPDALIALERSMEAEAKPEEKTLSTAERNTLLKLVIGMAIKGYGYDPSASKNGAPKDIASDLAILGMSVTDDTVRKYLAEAKNTVLPTKSQQSQ